MDTSLDVTPDTKKPLRLDFGEAGMGGNVVPETSNRSRLSSLADTPRKMYQNSGLSNALATLAVSLGTSGSFGGHTTPSFGARLGEGVLNMNQGNLSNLENIGKEEREEAREGREEEEYETKKKEREAMIEGRQRTLTNLYTPDATTGKAPIEEMFPDNKGKQTLFKSLLESGDEKAYGKATDMLLGKKEWVSLPSGGKLVNPDTGESIDNPKPTKEIEKTVDLGDRVRIQYADGHVEEVMKGTAPKSHAPNKAELAERAAKGDKDAAAALKLINESGGKGPGTAANVKTSLQDIDNQIRAHLKMKQTDKLNDAPEDVQALRTEAHQLIEQGKSPSEAWDDIKDKFPKAPVKEKPTKDTRNLWEKFAPTFLGGKPEPKAGHDINGAQTYYGTLQSTEDKKAYIKRLKDAGYSKEDVYAVVGEK